MSILVIGGTGFIGPRLIRKLVARGEDVVCMDINPGGGALADVPLRAPVLRGDVTRFEDVMRAVLEVKPERLINLAYGLGAGEGNPHQVFLLDVLGMDNCFEAARLAGVRRIVYASSIAVSGQQSHFGDRLANEDDPTYGTSQYVSDLTMRYLPDVSHWVQQEAPETVNAMLEAWLNGEPVPEAERPQTD